MKTITYLNLLVRGFVAGAFLVASFTSVAQLPNAWQITDNTSGASGGNYNTNLPPALQSAALTNGWRYTLRARLTDDLNAGGTMVFLYGVGTNRFSVFLDLDANDDLTAMPINQPTMLLTTNGTGAAMHHTYDIVYDPVTRRAAFCFDGIQRTTWDGDDVVAANGLIVWGSGASAGQGIMRFQSATFAIGTNVVAAYNAGVQGDPAVAPDPRTQGWSASGTSATTTNAVSPDITSLPSPLVATTLPATSVQLHTANLSGSVNLGGLAALAWIEWGTSTNYGNATPQFYKADSSTVGLALNLNSLIAGTTYHFRCVATNVLGAAYGQDMQFTTPPSLVVSTLADSGPGSLRQAIANAVSGDTITFATNGTVTLTSGQLDVTKSITIVSTGPTNLIIQRPWNASLFRIFRIVSGTTNTFSGLTIQGGVAPNGSNGTGAQAGGNGGDGGGIHNSGTLTLSNCVINYNYSGNGGEGGSPESGNGGPGGHGGKGGGIYNAGTLTLLACAVSYNDAGNGADGGDGAPGYFIAPNGGNGGPAGNGGSGGGIYSITTITCIDTVIWNNVGGQGGVGGYGGDAFLSPFADGGNGGAGGGGGLGGGVYLEGTATFTGSLYQYNYGGYDNGAGYGGYGKLGGNDGTVGPNARPGDGGGAYNKANSVFNGCVFYWNAAQDHPGDPAHGGAIFGAAGSLTLSDCTLTNNSASDGGGIYASAGSLTLNDCSLNGNSADSQGGGIYASAGSLTLNDCRLDGNSANNEGGAIYTFDPVTLLVRRSTFWTNVAPAVGGGIRSHGSVWLENSTFVRNHSTAVHNEMAALRIINCTIVENTVGIYSVSPIRLTNSIVALQTYDDLLSGTLGQNNFIGGNPLLAPLDNYGGPTRTISPQPGSPVVDAGLNSTTNFLATDQRGYHRRSGTRVDIGAVEVQQANPNNPPLLQPLALLPNGARQLNFTNDPAISFSVYASTNAAAPANQWTKLGNATQLTPGQYQYTDSSATNHTSRFYKIVWP